MRPGVSDRRNGRSRHSAHTLTACRNSSVGGKEMCVTRVRADRSVPQGVSAEVLRVAAPAPAQPQSSVYYAFPGCSTSHDVQRTRAPLGSFRRCAHARSWSKWDGLCAFGFACGRFGIIWRDALEVFLFAPKCQWQMLPWSGVFRAPLGSDDVFSRLEGETSNAPTVVRVVLELCMLLMLPMDHVTWNYSLLGRKRRFTQVGTPLDKERSIPIMRLWRNRLETVS